MAKSCILRYRQKSWCYTRIKSKWKSRSIDSTRLLKGLSLIKMDKMSMKRNDEMSKGEEGMRIRGRNWRTNCASRIDDSLIAKCERNRPTIVNSQKYNNKRIATPFLRCARLQSFKASKLRISKSSKQNNSPTGEGEPSFAFYRIEECWFLQKQYISSKMSIKYTNFRKTIENWQKPASLHLHSIIRSSLNLWRSQHFSFYKKQIKIHIF